MKWKEEKKKQKCSLLQYFYEQHSKVVSLLGKVNVQQFDFLFLEISPF